MRLTDQLGINEEQQTELTNLLFAFLKKMAEHKTLSETDTSAIVNWWLKCTDKPEWFKKRLQDDVTFVAGLHKLVNKYKHVTSRFPNIDSEYGPHFIIKQERLLLSDFVGLVSSDANCMNLSKEEAFKILEKKLWNPKTTLLKGIE